MHNQFKTQKFKHLMLAMGPRDLNSAPYSPIHCSSHSMTSFQSSELTELPVVENGQLFAQRVHSARTAHGTPPQAPAATKCPRPQSAPVPGPVGEGSAVVTPCSRLQRPHGGHSPAGGRHHMRHECKAVRVGGWGLGPRHRNG